MPISRWAIDCQTVDWLVDVEKTGCSTGKKTTPFGQSNHSFVLKGLVNDVAHYTLAPSWAGKPNLSSFFIKSNRSISTPNPKDNMQTVGIIGGSGFIGSYVTKKFLAGGYAVKVSATNLAKPEKYQHLQQLPNAENLTISQLDVTDTAALTDFVQGCDILIHSGTPFQLADENPEETVFKPTVRGTENFLDVVSQSPSVQKVVFVASVASLNTAYPMPVPNRPADYVYTEADEPYLDTEAILYAQAKYYADQAVRKFVATHPDPGFEIVSVLPTGVMGKPLSARDDSTSVGLQYLFRNKIAPNPFVQMLFDHDVEMAIVSVSDVAEGIFRAATTDGLHGKSYLLTGESWPVSALAAMLNHETPAGTARMVYSNVLATQELGMQFQPGYVPLHEYAAT